MSRYPDMTVMHPSISTISVNQGSGRIGDPTFEAWQAPLLYQPRAGAEPHLGRGPPQILDGLGV